MNRSLGLLFGTTVAVALFACSAGTDTTELGGTHYGAGGSGSGTTGETASSSGGPSSSSGAGTSSSSGSTTSSSSGGLPTQAPPDAGPGSTSSPAHQYFDNTVYPQLAVCQACHSTGTDGAPEMMDSPADKTYSELDALGLIMPSSLLLSKGSHDTGKAPALTTTQQTDITTWLNMEAAAAPGQAAPANVLSQVAACASETEFDAIPWNTLRTQPRTDENANKCTACNNNLCASCHSGGEQGFFMDVGTAFDPQGQVAFQQTFQQSSTTFMTIYFGLNGTAPVASDAILNKQTAVGLGPAYSHPMFVMTAPFETALNKFVTDTITNYTNNTCAGINDGGAPTSDDGGP